MVAYELASAWFQRATQTPRGVSETSVEREMLAVRKVHRPKSCNDPMVDGLVICEDRKKTAYSQTSASIKIPSAVYGS